MPVSRLTPAMSGVGVVPCADRCSADSRPPVGATAESCTGCRREVWLPAGSREMAALLGRRAVPTCFRCLAGVLGAVRREAPAVAQAA
ncbi:MAG TPA: hypothetical protein VFS29_04695 [Motilibacteraceae bacterium]|nr:hypothetical protein [Motilibacteraceae bacterium]